MAEQPKSIDVTNAPEILRLAEEVQRAGEPRVLQRNGQNLAVIVPLADDENALFRKPTFADWDAFRAAAGSWADIDTDTLIENIHRAREEGTRHDTQS